MCPEAYKLGKQIEVLLGGLSNVAAAISPGAGADGNRVYFRVLAEIQDSVFANDTHLNVVTLDGGVQRVVMTLTTSSPTGEISLAKHGALVWRAFAWDVVGAGAVTGASFVSGRIIDEVK